MCYQNDCFRATSSQVVPCFSGTEPSTPYKILVIAAPTNIKVKFRVKLTPFLVPPFKVMIIINNGTFTGEQLVETSLK